mgnify:CR=1 FL=1
MQPFLSTPKEVCDFACFLISKDFMQARNPFSVKPLPLDDLPKAKKTQDGVKHSIDCMPDIHYERDTAYHTPRHYYATAAFALALGQFNRLDIDDLDLLVTTALVHDFGYKLLIKDAVSQIEETHIAFACGLNVAPILDLDAMQNLNTATRYENRAALHDTISLCLSDADVMQSCLTPENYAVETALLEREIGKTIQSGFLGSVGTMRSCFSGSAMHPLEAMCMVTQMQASVKKVAESSEEMIA